MLGRTSKQVLVVTETKVDEDIPYPNLQVSTNGCCNIQVPDKYYRKCENCYVNVKNPLQK